MVGDGARLIGGLQVVGIALADAVGQFGDFRHGLALLFGTDRDLIHLPGQLPGALLHLIEQAAHRF
ncbi:hypothetical protein D9M68_897890 [compost metagenome]